MAAEIKYDIFISYSRKDSAVVDKICSALDKYELSYFRDTEGIAVGHNFPEILADAICQSRMMLYVASENSYKSRFTVKEISFAYAKEMMVIPYVIDNSSMPPRISFMFSDVNIKYMKDTPIDPDFIDDLCAHLGKKREPTDRKSGRLLELISNRTNQLIIVICMMAVALGFMLFDRFQPDEKEHDTETTTQTTTSSNETSEEITSEEDAARFMNLSIPNTALKRQTKQIGDIHEDGIIFDISPDSKVVSVVNYRQFRGEWMTCSTLASDHHDGRNNMQMLTQGNHVTFPIFAEVMNNYGEEWYIPSVNELEMIYLRRDILNRAMSESHMGDLIDGTYWSSTETGQRSAHVIDCDYEMKHDEDEGYKSQQDKYRTFNVCVIAKFDISEK